MRIWLGITLALVTSVVLDPGPAMAQRRVNVLCSVTLPWCDALGPAFKQATGIEVSFIRLSTGEGLARLRAESANPNFDAWFGGTGDPHHEASREGLTEWHQSKSHRDLRPELRDAVGTSYNPLYLGLLGFGINPTVLKEKGAAEPKCWKDLPDPAYRGLIQVSNPNTAGTGYTVVATLVQLFGEEDAFKLMKEMHRNVAEYTRSGVAPRIAVGRGDAAIGIQFMHDLVEFTKQGAPIKIVAPCEGTGYEIGGLSLIKRASRRAEAIEFIDWALSPEAQAIAFRVGAFSMPSNAKTPLVKEVPDPKTVKLIRYDVAKYGSPTVRDPLIARWTKEIFALPRR